jgi:ElaB/YqjD/DUF883 family membrane-anchored ribosome-binding protein
MGEEPGTGGTAISGSVSPSGDPEVIRREIEETREQLGDTVEALSAKTDVKGQARRKVADVKAKARATFGKAQDVTPETAASAAAGASETVRRNPVPAAAVSAFAAGFVVGRLKRK